MKGMSSILNGSSKYWKETLDNINPCSCTRSDIILTNIEEQITVDTHQEGKKAFF
jgi:hypothetical protein